jgi:hypothetical protein
VGRGGESVAVIHLDDLFETGTRQLSVANEDAQASGIEERLVDAANVVDDTGDRNRVVQPAPLLAGYRDARFQRTVDVGEIPRLDVAVGPAGASEYAQRLGNLLLPG